MVEGVKRMPGVHRIAMSDVHMVVVIRPVHVSHTPQQYLVVRCKTLVYFSVVRLGDHVPRLEIGKGVLLNEHNGGARVLIKYLPNETFQCFFYQSR